jgi:hypothetical protein
LLFTGFGASPNSPGFIARRSPCWGAISKPNGC